MLLQVLVDRAAVNTLVGINYLTRTHWLRVTPIGVNFPAIRQHQQSFAVENREFHPCQFLNEHEISLVVLFYKEELQWTFILVVKVCQILRFSKQIAQFCRVVIVNSCFFYLFYAFSDPFGNTHGRLRQDIRFACRYLIKRQQFHIFQYLI